MEAKSDRIMIAYGSGSKVFRFQDGENWCTRTGVGIECMLCREGKSHVKPVLCGHKERIPKTALQTHLFPIS